MLFFVFLALLLVCFSLTGKRVMQKVFFFFGYGVWIFHGVSIKKLSFFIYLFFRDLVRGFFSRNRKKMFVFFAEKIWILLAIFCGFSFLDFLFCCIIRVWTPPESDGRNIFGRRQTQERVLPSVSDDCETKNSQV